jgi:glycosyltransferase involved in cell wall biosynthesis
MKTERIKIIFFIDSFRIGGMHRQVLNLVKHLNKEIFEPIMCTSSSLGGLREEYERTGCRLFDLGWKRKLDPATVYKLVRVLNNVNPHIVYITEANNLFYFKVAKFFWHKKVVLIGSFRALTFWQGHRNRLFQIIDNVFSRWLYSSSKRIVVNSNALRDHYEHILKIKSEKSIEVINNGSDFNFAVSKSTFILKKELNIAPGDVVILMVARLDPWKDFETLLEAAKIVTKIEPEAKFFLLGDGELKASLEKMINQMGLKEKVFLLGERKDIFNYINLADISVLSTNGEGFSNSILESMAFGKPVIATNVGGNSELFGATNESGILVPPKSPGLFAEAIIMLIKDDALRNNIGQSAKERIHQICSIKKYISSYEDLFLNCLKVE